MRWYKDNPIDGNIAARSISVGLPIGCNIFEEDNLNEPHSGFVVPEADREVSKEPL